MAKKDKEITPREKHNEDIINELFGSSETEPDIETDITDLGAEPEEDVTIAPNPRRHSKFFFGLAIFVVIMACIGIVSTVRFVSDGVHNIMDNTSLKNEFVRFLLPVVANDIAPFENESEISNSAKVSCAMWNILVNKDISGYRSTESGNYIIPEYDVGVSCKELFGSSATITHQSVGASDTRFVYNETNHVYECSSNTRFLSYSPRITDMKENNGTYVLTVEYIPPSMSIITDETEVKADKVMEYTINRWDKKNTLMTVRMISGERL